jgi:hypothetical protein
VNEVRARAKRALGGASGRWATHRGASLAHGEATAAHSIIGAAIHGRDALEQRGTSTRRAACGAARRKASVTSPLAIRFSTSLRSNMCHRV